MLLKYAGLGSFSARVLRRSCIHPNLKGTEGLLLDHTKSSRNCAIPFEWKPEVIVFFSGWWFRQFLLCELINMISLGAMWHRSIGSVQRSWCMILWLLFKLQLYTLPWRWGCVFVCRCCFELRTGKGRAQLIFLNFPAMDGMLLTPWWCSSPRQ